MQVLANADWTANDKLLAKQAILDAGMIVVSGHRGPDGDSLGSMLSLGLGIEKLGKQVAFLGDPDLPDRYAALPGADRISPAVPRRVDLAIAVDCASVDMLTFQGARAFARARKTLEIDHHEFRTPFCDIACINPNAAAVGEIIFALLDELHAPVSQDIAQNILTSIIVETNSFRLPVIRPQTFEIAAQLLRTGVDFHKLTETVFWSRTKQTALLAGACLGRCRFMLGGSVAWSIITRADMRRVCAVDFDVDPLAEELRAINGVKVAILFREREDGLLRVSLRSKHGINVAELAELYGGGGHTDIAGCVIKNSRREKNRLLLDARYLIMREREKASALSSASAAVARWEPAYRVSANW